LNRENINMATDQYPQRNVNMPMDEAALRAARAKLDPGVGSGPMPSTPQDGKGSRREIRKGEWIDDRVIVIGGPASPSEDSPPDLPKKSERALPTFTAGKAYQVTLGKACIFAGRVLSPAKAYQMTGETCLDPEVQPCIVDAVELGDTPTSPDVAPSAAETGKAKKKA
jgi:hypothetical protein